jgi:pilus assembly protein CpaB
MLLRNLLLALGGLGMLAGVVLSVVWFIQLGRTSVETPAASRAAVLVATHPVPAGTLVRKEDITWKEVGPGEIHAGNIIRGQISESEFVGAIARRAFAAGEQLILSEIVRPNERQFLAAVLKPGTRAVSISVEAPQSGAGLILPGDYVDVILTQAFDEPTVDATHKSVAETVLRNVQIIAVDQALSMPANPAPAARGALTPATPVTASRVPKTYTFALTEQQAEQLFVAAHLGRLQFSVRPLEGRNIAAGSEDGNKRAPTWASDVSSALDGSARKGQPSASSIESSVRRPPILHQPAVPQSVGSQSAIPQSIVPQ